MQQQPQQPLLGFFRITADDAAQQRASIARKFAAEHALHPPAAAPQKRPVERPKRQRDVADVLVGAAAAAAAASSSAAAAALPSTAVVPLDEPVSKRGKYTTVILAILQEANPSLLRQHRLSQLFISRWVRQQLDWRWRARTTAASKLPADWDRVC
jgi:hypothetical protein